MTAKASSGSLRTSDICRHQTDRERAMPNRSRMPSAAAAMTGPTGPRLPCAERIPSRPAKAPAPTHGALSRLREIIDGNGSHQKLRRGWLPGTMSCSKHTAVVHRSAPAQRGSVTGRSRRRIHAADAFIGTFDRLTPNETRQVERSLQSRRGPQACVVRPHRGGERGTPPRAVLPQIKSSRRRRPRPARRRRRGRPPRGCRGVCRASNEGARFSRRGGSEHGVGSSVTPCLA
jgi:hypothetical protein